LSSGNFPQKDVVSPKKTILTFGFPDSLIALIIGAARFSTMSSDLLQETLIILSKRRFIWLHLIVY